MINELKQINLSENDFQVLVKALDALASHEAQQELIHGIMGAVFIQDSENKRRFDAERKAEAAKKKGEQERLVEDIRMLQGKLLAMKRYMRDNNLLTQPSAN